MVQAKHQKFHTRCTAMPLDKLGISMNIHSRNRLFHFFPFDHRRSITGIWCYRKIVVMIWDVHERKKTTKIQTKTNRNSSREMWSIVRNAIDTIIKQVSSAGKQSKLNELRASGVVCYASVSVRLHFATTQRIGQT